MTNPLRPLLVDGPHSLGNRFRARRWQRLLETFRDFAEFEVIDLGGTVESWSRAPVRPRSVTILNMFEPGISSDPSLSPIVGDACNAREVLERAGRNTKFDLVYCNSVIEHVGGHAKRLELAREVHALAPRHWVQTPYRYFPIEPHWLCPIMQFLPLAAAARLAFRWPLAHSRPNTYEQARDEVMWTELLTVTQMRTYFSTSTIFRERFVGLTKSLITVLDIGS